MRTRLRAKSVHNHQELRANHTNDGQVISSEVHTFSLTKTQIPLSERGRQRRRTAVRSEMQLHLTTFRVSRSVLPDSTATEYIVWSTTEPLSQGQEMNISSASCFTETEHHMGAHVCLSSCGAGFQVSR